MTGISGMRSAHTEALEKASIISDRHSGRSKGFGFVTMNDADETNKAIEAMNGSEMGRWFERLTKPAPVKIAHPGNRLVSLPLSFTFKSPPLADFFFAVLIGQNLLV